MLFCRIVTKGGENMNIDQLKELEDLKYKHATLQKESGSLFKSNVEPLIEKYKSDLMIKIAEYLKGKGFNVRKDETSIKATYRDLEIAALLDSNWISIKEDGKEKAKARVKYPISSGYSMSVPKDEFQAAKARILKDIEQVEKDIKLYAKPVVFYELNGLKCQDTAEELVKKIFS